MRGLETEPEKERQNAESNASEERQGGGKEEGSQKTGLVRTQAHWGSWANGDPQHACADLELGVLCLAGGVPGPSSCSISGSMAEGCSGVTALLPWRAEWGVAAGSRWELEAENRRNRIHPSSQSRHGCSGNGPDREQGTRLHTWNDRHMRSLDSAICPGGSACLQSGSLSKGVQPRGHAKPLPLLVFSAEPRVVALQDM